jgi:hypothetical protein
MIRRRTVTAFLVLIALHGPPRPASGLVANLGSGEDWVERDTAITVSLSRVPQPGEGRVAVTIGRSDVSDLFSLQGTDLVYRPELLPLTVGESEVAVFLVAPGDDWKELGRFPLRVLTPGGFQRAEIEPSLDLASQALLADGPGDLGNETGFRDATGQLNLKGTWVHPGYELRVAAQVLGVTEAAQAIRFRDLGEDAPRADLASYQLRLQRGQTRVEVGHLSFGDSRHLIRSFSSRGLALGSTLGRRGEIAVGAFAGTSMVGWDNPLGIADADHRILSGRVAFDLLPTSPGALRLEGTVLGGSVLPRSGFSAGNINDRERSDGWSLRLRSAVFSRRLRVEGGYAESSFRNPEDPLLDQGKGDLVEVESETRSARFLDLAWDVVRDRPLAGGELPFTLTAGYRQERVEPLYRTVATFVRSDLDQDVYDLTATLGPISAQVTRSDARDNLDDIPSILTTRTRRQGAHLMIPLGELPRTIEGAGRWLPILTYGLDRTHQYGLEVPENSLFEPGHVPDQVSLSHTAGLEWMGATWRFGYRYSLSDQDNRQPGRENADFETRVHGVSLGLAPHARVDLSFDVDLERSDNLELEEVTETLRYGVGAQLRLADWTSLAGSASWSETETGSLEQVNESSVLDLQWTVHLRRLFGERRGAGAQLFLRYSYQQTELRDPVFELEESFRNWGINSGINLSLF